MLLPRVNYLQFIGYEYDTAKRVMRNEGYRKGHQSSKRKPNMCLKNSWTPYIAIKKGHAVTECKSIMKSQPMKTANYLQFVDCIDVTEI